MREKPTSVQPSPDPQWMVRKREVLAMAAAAGVSMLLLPPGFAWADPVPLPNNFPNSLGCPAGSPGIQTQVKNAVPIPFTPPSYEVKVRRCAETLKPTSEYWLLYERAYELLRKKAEENPGDPRYYTLQALAHCKYCLFFYKYNYPAEDKSTEYSVNIHSNYLFLPWHRLYLHFHERILHSLLKEDPDFADRADEFALPFWNYDNMVPTDTVTNIPPLFDQKESSLYDKTRPPGPRDPLLAPLSSDLVTTVASNLTGMKSAVFDQTTAETFFGGPISAGKCLGGPGRCVRAPSTLERVVHNQVHDWIGGDMSDLSTASMDPIFFGGHHSNIDRLWTVWETLPSISGNPRTPPKDDPDWMNAGFLFFDENGYMVVAKVSDALDPLNNLKYIYENVPNPWLYVQSATPTPSPSGARLAPARPNPSLPASSLDDSPVELGANPIVITSVQRPPEKAKLPLGRGANLLRGGIRAFTAGPEDDAVELFSIPNMKEEDLVELLVIEGLDFDMMERLRLNVFINLPDANQNTPNTVPQYVGSFFNLPMRGMDMETDELTLKFNITRQLAELKVKKEDVSVSIVPIDNSVKITFKQVRIE